MERAVNAAITSVTKATNALHVAQVTESNTEAINATRDLIDPAGARRIVTENRMAKADLAKASNTLEGVLSAQTEEEIDEHEALCRLFDPLVASQLLAPHHSLPATTPMASATR